MINENVIIDYFDTCEIHYRRLWDLQNSMAMHYGYWDETTKHFPDALRNENRLLAQLIQVQKDDIILDAGSGVGGSAIFLAKEFGCKVIGVTLSEKQVATSRCNAQKHNVAHLVDFQQRDYLHTGFPDEYFTVVWAVESVCYCNDKKDFLAESSRLLQNNGRIIIADGFLKEGSLNNAEEKQICTWLEGWGIPNLSRASEFILYLEKLRFKTIEFRDCTKHVIPSSKRMYYPSIAMYPVTMILEWLRIRKRIQTQHVIGAIYQYMTLRKRIWKYGICHAQKQE